MRTKKGQKGFTLVEVMIVVAIVGILAAIAMPVLLNSLPNMRLRSAARDIYSTMMQAKIEALRRGENVTLLFNSPFNPLVPPNLLIPPNAYIMFVDNGAGGGVANDEVPNGAEAVLVAATTLPDRITFDPAIGGGDGVTFVNNSVVFTLRGIPGSAANTPPSGLGEGTVGLRAVDSLGNTQRQRAIVVRNAGRISIQ